MKNFKNVICGFILPILLLIVLPYIGFWLYNQNYIHNYIEQSIMNGKYMGRGYQMEISLFFIVKMIKIHFISYTKECLMN